MFDTPQQPKPKHPGGRPTNYNLPLAIRICERLAHGEPLKRICDDPDFPGYSTVKRWELEIEEFRALSSRARDIGTDHIADECIEIADNSLLDPHDRRIRIDTRLRLIGKWNAKRYGDRQQIDANVTQTVIQQRTVDARLLTADQRELLREIAARMVAERRPEAIEGDYKDVSEPEA